ncbi:hypothetical protein D9M71_119470 [compost metagenome]
MPLPRLGLEERHEAVEARVVHQHCRHAEVFLDGCHGIADGVVVGDVGGVGDCLATGFEDQVDRGLGRCAVAVEHSHATAFGGKAQADSAADAATAAGDDNGFSIKTFHGAILQVR